MAQIIVAELRPRLQACSIFITVEANFLDHNRMKITIKSSSILVTWESCSDLFTQNILLPGCKLIPNSLSCFHVEDEFISFRVQTEPVIGVQGSFVREILTVSSNSATETRRNESVAAGVSSGNVCLFTCHCCGNKLLKKTFRRVLPLPSGTLDSSEWFCHDHGHGSSSFSLIPSVEDLFYSSCCFILNVQSLFDTALSKKFVRVARCKRCLAWLGTISSSHVTFWDSTVCLENNSSVVPLQDFVKVIGNAISSCVGLMCRIVVETQFTDVETHYLLLWVIDKNLKILTNSYKNLDVRDNNGDIVLGPKSTVKLLYLHQSSLSSTVKAWQDDVNVQTIDVAKPMFTEGLEYLTKMTKCLPRGYRVSNNYLTAYLDI